MGFNMRFRVRLSAVRKVKPEVLYNQLMVSQICADCPLQTRMITFHHSNRCVGSERMVDLTEQGLTTGTEWGKGQEQWVWTQMTKGYS